MYFEQLLEKLEKKNGCPPKRCGNGYICQCPAHDDEHPSLAVSEGDDGKILLKCHAGCSVESICAKLGLIVSDLFPRHDIDGEDRAEKVDYIYVDEARVPLYKKTRLPGKQFYISSSSQSGEWIKGLKCERRVLYRLPEVMEAGQRGEKIWLVEGEKDADRLRQEGLVATTPIEGAGSGLSSWYVQQLTGAHVVLLYDEDRAGHKRRDQWRNLLVGTVASLHILALPGLKFQENGGADVSDWLNDGHDIKELSALLEKAASITTDTRQVQKKLLAVNLDDFLAMEIPVREMILAPIIPAQGLVMVYSKRGVGKTFLSLSIACAVATGVSFLRWRCDFPVKVLFVDGEMPAKLMQERLEQLVLGFGKELPDNDYFRLVTPDLQEEGIPDIATEEGQRLIENELGDAKLLILDNLSTLAPSVQENESDSWAPIQCWLLKLRKQGISVVLVHHAGKSGQQRGTSRREDVLDSVIVLKHAEGYSSADGATFEVHIEKARGFFGEGAESFVARLQAGEDGALGWSEAELKDNLYEEVIVGVQTGKSYRVLADELKITKSKVEGIVKRARQKGDLPEVKNG